jgi:hypothetical protein
LRDIVLQRKDVVHRAVVGLRPQLKAVLRFNELHADANAIAAFSHTTFEHRGNAQDSPNVFNGGLLTFETERRSSRRDAQSVDLREHVEEFIREAVGEIFVICRRASIGEGEHGNRWNDRGFSRRK